MYACKIQNGKFGTVLTTAYRSNSRKAYCKVCNNAIIDRFFAFNCCKKDQSNAEILSEWTSFGAVKALRRQGSTIPFKMYHVLLSRAPSSEKHFTFLLVKSAMQNYFHNVQVPCCSCVAWYETRTTFSLLYSHLRWNFCGVMFLHVARVWAGSFAVLVFLHSSTLEFGRGIQSTSYPWARA